MTLRLGLEATEVYNLAASQFSRCALSVQSEQRETTERLLWSHSKTRSVYHGVTARRGASLLRLRLPSLPRIFGCCVDPHKVDIVEQLRFPVLKV